MEQLHTEKYPGVNGEDFVIRIFDQHTEIEVAINLEYYDNGEHREVNIRRDTYPTDSDLKDLIEKSKMAITLITIVKRL